MKSCSQLIFRRFVHANASKKNHPKEFVIRKRIYITKHSFKELVYNYDKGPNDPTYISADRVHYMYGLTPKDIKNLRKIRLRNAIGQNGTKMICYVEKDLINLCLKKGMKPCNFIPEERVMVKDNNTVDNEAVIYIAISTNIMIFFGKLIMSYSTGSTSMLAETIHSLIDILNQLILGVGAYYSRKGPTPEHPYGWSRARYVSSLISSVSVLTMGTAISIWEGIISLLYGTELQDLHNAILLLLVSAGLESFSFCFAFKSIINKYKQTSNERLFSRKFYDYIIGEADPVALAVLMEDLLAIFGLIIALICILLSYKYSSSVPDSFGSILIGILFGAGALLVSRRSVNFLIEKSISRQKKESIVDLIEGDKLVRSVHDVKATMMGDGTVKFKAEINYDGAELAKAYLYGENRRKLLRRIKKVKTQRQLTNFTIHQSMEIMNKLGLETDRLEGKIKKKYPELRHIDLETL